MDMLIWFPNRYTTLKFQQSADVKKQTVFFLQTADVWSTSSAAEDCRCGPQTTDVLASKKQTPPMTRFKSIEYRPLDMILNTRTANGLKD
ncbi:hypothetical protein LXL04_002666 [Taraxacum kok-saghyz]